MSRPRRFVELEGSLNFRDIGGYSTHDGRVVRWRRLYRSDALHNLTEAAAEQVHEKLRVSTIVDLRSREEIRETGKGPIHSKPIQIHHQSLFDEIAADVEPQTRPFRPEDTYLYLLRNAKSTIGRVIRIVAETREPAVFHCAAGKDRTGIIAAVLLGVLGVREEDIIEDYAQTGLNIDSILEQLDRSPAYQLRFRELPAEMLHASPETMASFLAGVRSEYGEMRAYAREAGITDDVIQQLESILLS